MKPSILRWTLLLLATLTVLTAATAAFRSGPGAEVPAKALPPATITYSGTSEPAPDIASTPETPAVVIVDRAPVAPPERR
ncbi:MAG: hypothetical protein JO332_03065, partial [Planctomycetaceae bacterium]|nr:hypothetical protein [Planctomycetaceae bacterium]